MLNLSLPGLDSEALMVATKDLIAVFNGSACTKMASAGNAADNRYINLR